MSLILGKGLQQRAFAATPVQHAPLPAARGHRRSQKSPRRSASTRFSNKASTLQVEEPLSATTSADSAAAPRAAGATAGVGESFVWTCNWYPVLGLDYLKDPKEPIPIKLLGKDLVLWQDGDQVRCFEDACPHRLAPLSEGRVEDGQLMCSYHGWSWNGDGKCTRIPQIETEKAQATARASPRSCARTYPVTIKAQIIWVWPDPTPEGHLTSAAHSPIISRELEEAYAAGKTGNVYMRELPYGYDVLMENLTDPQHLPWSHHKLTPMMLRSLGNEMPMVPLPLPSEVGQTAAASSNGGSNGNGNAESKSLNGSAAQRALVAGALPKDPASVYPGAFSAGFTSIESKDSTLTFVPPSLVVYRFPGAGGWVNHTELRAVPTEPGRSKVLTSTVSTAPKVTLLQVLQSLFKPATFMRTLMRYTFANLPKWRLHLFSNKLFDQDGAFLAMQDGILHKKRGGDWKRSYYTPAAADSVVIAARKWLDAVRSPYPTVWGQDGAAAAQLLPGGWLSAGRERRGKRELADRWEQHTKHCPHCMEAFAGLQRRLQAAKWGAGVAFLALCAALGAWGVQGVAARGVPAAVAGAAAAALALCGLVAKQSSDALPAFSYVEFSHAHND